MDYAIEELKKQAASLGADGVFFENCGERCGSEFGKFVSNGFGGASS